ncbi:HEPN domain-containing protein [Chryseobacterium aahli]|uniref:HEPN domain-containing protein n=1 Tax=Chryseobacterium aahli TaxID=1278643 RepID=UPI001F60CB9B|nr:HEPN domain-containing protein [Chryseobacterium aahli]MCI3935664.1 HEPN domain-containing protein [Chryseobacterium aahli]
MKELLILIIKNSNKDLSLLDFPEFKIVNIHDEDFVRFLEDTNTPSEDFINLVVENQKYSNEPRFAIFQKDLSQILSIKKVYDVFNFLKVLFPSALEIEFTLSYHYNPELKFLSSFKNDESFASENNYVDFDETKSNSINKFIAETYNRLTNIKYINTSKINYINAYESSHYHFSFIAFCITLESLIDGNTELLYKISRATALICGKDVDTCNIIFKNVKKIYSLRSKIVHGSEFDDDLVSKYLFYLECLCSKVLIELLIHNIENHQILNEKFTILGFGYRNEISSNWYNFEYNPKIENIIYETL